jgi:hypothetical protein
MAGPYYVDDGGDGSTESSWATADTSINDLDAEYTFASGEIVYFGHNSQCQAINAASLTITGPTASPPVKFISATQGSSPPTYQVATANQIDTTENVVYDITFDGSFALYGMQIAAGRFVNLQGDNNEATLAANCKFIVGYGGGLNFSSYQGCKVNIFDCVIDLSADGTTNRSTAIHTTAGGGTCELYNLTYINPGYRTGTVFNDSSAAVELFVSGCDFSNVDYSTKACEIFSRTGGGTSVFVNCKTAATWAPFASGYGLAGGSVSFINCGYTDSPTYLTSRGYCGDLTSSTSVVRTGGAAIEDTPVSWSIITSTTVCEADPLYTPWIYFKIPGAGTKTVDIYITHDAATTYAADFTDAEAWIEVEAMATDGSPLFTRTTDRRANVTTDAVAQTDDTASTWTGTGPSFTYMQKLSVSVVVGEEGLCRARVAFGAASITGSHYCYVDPQVFVDGVAAGTGQYLIPGVGIVEYSGSGIQPTYCAGVM